MTQTSNNPVVLMMKPDSILVQEIKVVPAKAKVLSSEGLFHINIHGGGSGFVGMSPQNRDLSGVK